MADADEPNADAGALQEEAQKSRDALMGLLLPFQQALVSELLQEDGLAILAPGLGLHQVVAVLLRLQNARLREPGQRGVVLVLGAAAWQRDTLRRELARIDPLAAQAGAATEGGEGGPAEVNNEVPAAERVALYHSRAVLFVTTRILVVDLLSGRLSARDVAGLVVLNAQRVTDTSGEGFATRLFKGGHPQGFVRAFSDLPSAFTAEFNKVEKVMKALHVRRLHLWPRFQAQVKADLEARPPELVELSLGMSPAMGVVYDAIAELMDACVKELRKTNKLDTTDLTVDQSLLKSFDEIVRRQLNSIWHTVSPKTKQIVADLRTLRTLAGFLLRFDPLTFLTYLHSLRATEGSKSVWLFHSAAHAVFEAAKTRVYRLERKGGRKRKAGGTAAEEAVNDGDAASAAAMSIQPVLEPLPKWELLREVMGEVQAERAALLEAQAEAAAAQQEAQQEGEAAECGAAAQGAGDAMPVLVVCQDAFTASQLREVLASGGPEALLQRLYREYLQQKLEGGGVAGGGGKPKKPLKEPAGAGGRGEAGPGPPRMMGGLRPGEEAALLKEAKALAGPLPSSGTGRGRGRRGGGGGRGSGRGGRGGRTGGTAARNTGRKGQESPPPQGGEDEATSQGDGASTAGPSAAAAAVSGPLLEGVQFCCLESHEGELLWELGPAFVVMYDPDVAFIRQLELYKAQSSEGRPLRVYLLRYEDSAEMDRYQVALGRERGAFEALIKAKEIMTLPSLAPAEPARRLPAVHADLGLLGAAANPLTRRAGGLLPGRAAPKRIVVDVREFMSSLPAVLHQQGLELVPITLEVGDYVLSPELCVERKSIADLRSSLQSGRLYHQAEAMTKHYKTPLLLIEFEGDKAFALQASSEIGDEVQLHSLMSKLALLCLHFPRLRLIWSRSLHATADMFQSLKGNHEEPDPVAAAAVGLSEADGAGGANGQGTAAGAESVVNQAAIDLLRRLPGVTEANWRPLMRSVGSLAELADTPLETLAEIMGGQAAARKLHEFLHQECRQLFHAL